MIRDDDDDDDDDDMTRSRSQSLEFASNVHHFAHR